MITFASDWRVVGISGLLRKYLAKNGWSLGIIAQDGQVGR